MTEENQTSTEPEINWDKLRPALDEAIIELQESDREAIVLRYFQGRDLRTMSFALGISNEAARKRTERAVERLGVIMSRRGVHPSTESVLGTLLASASIVSAPLGLEASIVRTVFTTLSTTTSTLLAHLPQLRESES